MNGNLVYIKDKQLGYIENSPGIYFIQNKINNKYYIGSSNNVRLRLSNHKSKLRNNTHHSYKLQRSFNKHGFDNFEFGVIEYFTFPIEYPKKLIAEHLECREEYYIKKLQSYKKGYNVSEVPHIVVKSKETIEKQKATLLKRGGYKHTPESRKKLSISIRNSIQHKIGAIKTGLKNRKPIHQYNLSGEYIQSFSSIFEASDCLQIPISTLRKSRDGTSARCRNFMFSNIKTPNIPPYINPRPKKYKKRK